MRLSTRIALSAAVIVPVLALATNYLLLDWFTGDLRAEQERQLRSRATTLTHNAQAYLQAVEAGHPVAARNARRRLVVSSPDVGFRLRAPGGVVAAGPRHDPALSLPDEAREPVVLDGAGPGGTKWLVMSRRVTPPNGTPPDRPNLWMYSPDTAYRAQLARVRHRILTVALLSAPVTGAIAWLIASRATLPLRRLQHRANGLDPRSTVLRLDHTPSGVTEVDDLAGTLRTVLARYDEQAARAGEALETARSFAAAASHEMRNPLTSMRTNLDVLTEYPDLDAADREEVLADLAREQARLLGLLGMLRTLAQGDLVEADAFTTLDLGALVRACVRDLRRSHPGALPTVRAADGLLVHAWQEGLRSAVDNLLINAWTHGRTRTGDARMEVTLRAVQGFGAPAAVLTVDDHGTGVPPELREAVFRRFHRSRDSPGSGLGLTLVAQQVALHQGRIVATDRPDGTPGARFEVRLPVTGVQDVTHTLPLLRRDWLTAAD
ncbi:two-component sensor histidine kinase [Streptomyces sp. CB09001]|uniref:sensor histidine kinase n=1 Tax=Streptomyces sp. CB09001 TaxID=2083284 RepID=UPI000E2171B0|nr:HAMP domain-containing sensor histidine kinase [Streptomyces sp. CB09001]AXL90248.1 two-component sensor histidine kinase [Streptomyces sp. CB09001]